MPLEAQIRAREAFIDLVQPVAPHPVDRSESTPADGVGSATTIAGPRLSPFRSRKREDYVPATEVKS